MQKLRAKLAAQPVIPAHLRWWVVLDYPASVKEAWVTGDSFSKTNHQTDKEEQTFGWVKWPMLVIPGRG